MPACKKSIKFQDKDGDVFVLTCVDSEGHEGNHQTSAHDVIAGFSRIIWFEDRIKNN